ncbi:hypothetical protein GBF38_000230, partial [Nibea albiflora]
LELVRRKVHEKNANIRIMTLVSFFFADTVVQSKNRVRAIARFHQVLLVAIGRPLPLFLCLPLNGAAALHDPEKKEADVNVEFPIGSTSDAIGRNLRSEHGTTPEAFHPLPFSVSTCTLGSGSFFLRRRSTARGGKDGQRSDEYAILPWALSLLQCDDSGAPYACPRYHR